MTQSATALVLISQDLYYNSLQKFQSQRLDMRIHAQYRHAITFQPFWWTAFIELIEFEEIACPSFVGTSFVVSIPNDIPSCL